MTLGYSDAPVPTSAPAQFAMWKQYVDESVSRALRPSVSKYMLTITGTTDASGFLTFFHDAQVIPQGIICIVTEPTLPTSTWCARVDLLTETTARARFLESSAGSVVSHATTSTTFFAWIIV